MEQNQLYTNVPNPGENSQEIYEEKARKESKLPLLSAIFSGLTLILTIIILILVLVSSNRSGMGNGMRNEDMFENGTPSFDMNENNANAEE